MCLESKADKHIIKRFNPLRSNINTTTILCRSNLNSTELFIFSYQYELVIFLCNLHKTRNFAEYDENMVCKDDSSYCLNTDSRSCITFIKCVVDRAQQDQNTEFKLTDSLHHGTAKGQCSLLYGFNNFKIILRVMFGYILTYFNLS